MSKSILTVAALAVVTVVAACDRAPVETPGPVVVPTAPLSVEPVYQGKAG